MAFKAIHGQSFNWRRRRHSIDSPNSSSANTYFFLKPTTTAAAAANSLQPFKSSLNILPFSLSSSTASSTSSKTISSFDLLHQHLSSQNFRQADEETRRLLIILAGEAAQKRGYVFFSEVQFISQDDLKAIDELWRKYSNNRFGYSVQKRIWNKTDRDFTKFFIKIGWMKKLETEVVQYNYRAFPEEFIWEMDEETPEGHLPLTNALRGTQLLSSILTHPAFQGEEEEENDKKDDDVAGGEKGGLASKIKPLINKVFKTDYSF